MKKIILASASAIALLGLAACSENADTTTTQSLPEEPTQQNEPAATPPAQENPPAEEQPAPAQ